MTRLPQPFHRWAFYHWTAYRRWYNKRAFRDLNLAVKRLAASMQSNTISMGKFQEMRDR